MCNTLMTHYDAVEYYYNYIISNGYNYLFTCYTCHVMPPGQEPSYELGLTIIIIT